MTYAGLTTADKGALLDAKARGDNWAARDSSERLMTYPSKPFKMLHGIDIWAFDNEEGEHAHEIDYTLLTFIQWSDAEPVNIDLALAQIAEMESAEKPMTWNERINQMTVEEKADVAVIMSRRCSEALSKKSCPDLTCWQCFIEFLNSPYTEGATDEG